MKYNTPAKPPKAALEYFRSKELKPSFDHRDISAAEHGYAHTAAKVMQLDILEAIQNAVDQALAEGRTLAQFKKDLQPTLEKLGWWGKQEMVDPLTGDIVEAQLGSPRRLKTIYRVNMRTARAAGQWDRIERTKKTHPYLVYELGPSREHRDQHVKWAGLILPAADPFWQTHFPPNGYGCKCRVRQVSKREYERLQASGKYATQAPGLDPREWVNKRTGEVTLVPNGISPGFDINAGIARQTHIQNIITTKLNGSRSNIAAAAAKSLVQGPAFKQFYKNPKGAYPIAALDSNLKSILKADQNAVLLSEQTLVKQLKNHPDLTLAEYRLLPDIINRGEVIQESGQNLIFYHAGGKLYKAVVKATRDGSELYLTTFFRTQEPLRSRDKKRGPVLRAENNKGIPGEEG